MKEVLLKARLYGILDTGYVAPEAMATMAQQLLSGGIDLLQLRAKKIPEEKVIEIAREILPWTRAAKVPFIINDYPHLVPLVGAQGAHIGQDDMSVQEARSLAGEGAVIGLSTHSLLQVQKASEAQPDYIGFGPLFATPTKPEYTPIGLADIATAQAMVSFPLFCIGGITQETLPSILRCRAERVVIVSEFLKAGNPQECVASIKQKLITTSLRKDARTEVTQ